MAKEATLETDYLNLKMIGYCVIYKQSLPSNMILQTFFQRKAEH